MSSLPMRRCAPFLCRASGDPSRREGSGWLRCGLVRPGPALALAALLLPGAAGALNVRVLVASAPQLTVRVPATPAPADALSGPGLPVPSAAPTTAWTVGVSGSGAAARLTLNGQDTGNTSLYLPPRPGSVVEIAGKRYRGGVQLRAEGGGVQGINVVDVEDYLRGVVPAEMPTSWPAAALAAQAVIARTYVAARINPALPFDTCATESCQVYPGVSVEKASADAAIRQTAGQVVAYGGRPASTFFSSDSGGYTASSAEVWGKALPYLVAQPDPYSAGGPRARWRLEVSAEKLAQAAARHGVRGTVRAVAVTRASASGRPQEITLTTEAGPKRLSGADAGGFVRSLGAGGTRVSLNSAGLATGGPLVLEGSGAGHGVGLSQYGALGLARAGYSHLHVLGFYYPGTSLSVLAGADGGARLAAAQPLPRPELPPLPLAMADGAAQ